MLALESAPLYYTDLLLAVGMYVTRLFSSASHGRSQPDETARASRYSNTKTVPGFTTCEHRHLATLLVDSSISIGSFVLYIRLHMPTGYIA